MGNPPQITLLFRFCVNDDGKAQEVTISMDDPMQKAFAKVLVFQNPMSVSAGDGGWDPEDWVFVRKHKGVENIVGRTETPYEIGLKNGDLITYG